MAVSEATLPSVEETSTINSPVVRTSYGSVRGFERRGCFVFRGLPYASPPTRFKRPEPPRPWQGIRDCLRHGSIALQTSLDLKVIARQAVIGGTSSTISPVSSEDCLFLNIATPSFAGGPKPVLCWIHGGAFVLGSGGGSPMDSYFDGGVALARKHNLVVVSINYRLGCLGFLNIPGGDPNCGSWDQLEALRWIHTEIRNFGGDPRCVTIAGESAGGMSCGILLTSPLARPFFNRAILMSGALSNVMEHKHAEAAAQKFCSLLGKQAHANELRNVTQQELLDAQVKLKGGLSWQPCVDGVLIPALPLDAVASGSVSIGDKDVIIGFTADEFNLFNPFPAIIRSGMKLDEASRRAKSFDGENREHRGLLKTLRSDRKLPNWGVASNELSTMLLFKAPALVAAEALSPLARRVFVYSYDFNAGTLGAAHASELSILFGTYENNFVQRSLSGFRQNSQGAAEVSRTLMACVGSFAHKGEPELPPDVWEEDTLASWPQFGAVGEASRICSIGQTCAIRPMEDDAAMRQAMRLVREQRSPWGTWRPPFQSAKL
eukprot:TRINITY_DN68674_c0_g1_i1.p1 TRINITY_DN68674_c0_g1~~TRINITY_DN68674_c0_g1_i1.p1  ORF type:complete len:565 (-),score=75.35 TRINITY_DN68674_c0_g1_i1:29-1672(-)